MTGDEAVAYLRAHPDERILLANALMTPVWNEAGEMESVVSRNLRDTYEECMVFCGWCAAWTPYPHEKTEH